MVAHTYNLGDFSTLPQSVDRKGVDGTLHWNGIDLHHPVVLTAYT